MFFRNKIGFVDWFFATRVFWVFICVWCFFCCLFCGLFCFVLFCFVVCFVVCFVLFCFVLCHKSILGSAEREPPPPLLIPPHQPTAPNPPGFDR